MAGSNPSSGPLTWSFTTGGYVFSSPAVVNGVVYVGSWDNNIYAINASTGGEAVELHDRTARCTPPRPSSTAWSMWGAMTGNYYALNATTGAKLWSYTTGGYVGSSPAVVNSVVYVGSYDRNVYALNATTGAKLWSYTTGSSVCFPLRPSPTASSTWGAMTTTSTPSTPPPGRSCGATRPETAVSSPAVANGVVYVGSDDGNVYALNATTGAKLWSYTTGGYVWLLSRRRQRGGLRGELVTTTSTPSTPPPGRNCGATRPEAVLTPLPPSPTAWSTWGAMTTTSTPSTPPPGRSCGATRPEATVFSSPAVVNGVVYVGSNDGNVYALSTAPAAASQNTTPGFGVMLAFVGFVIVAYVVRRRR